MVVDVQTCLRRSKFGYATVMAQTCQICLEELLDNLASTTCGHVFHEDWLVFICIFGMYALMLILQSALDGQII